MSELTIENRISSAAELVGCLAAKVVPTRGSSGRGYHLVIARPASKGVVPLEAQSRDAAHAEALQKIEAWYHDQHRTAASGHVR